MLHKAFIILIVVCWSSNLVSQNNKTPLDVFESLTRNENFSAEKKRALLDSLIHGKMNNLDLDRLAKIYNSLLKSFYRKNINISIEYALKIKAIDESLNNQDEFYLKNDKNLVNLYYMKGSYHKSIVFGKEFLKKYPEETVRQAIVYRVLGNCYSDLGDFREAIAHYNKAIYILKEYQDFMEEGRTLINLLEAYVKIDHSLFNDEVFELIQRFEVISQIYEFSDSDVIKMELNAGAFYDGIEDYDNAKIRYSKSLKLSTALADTLNICNSLINLGIVNRKVNRFEESKNLFNLAIPYSKYSSEKRASLYNNLADLYKEEEHYNQALIYYHNAIIAFLQIENTSIFHVPNINALNTIDNKVDLLGYIIDKANLLLVINDEKEKKKHLKLALKLYDLSDQIVDIIYFESREDFSKLFWRKEASEFYSNATEAAYKLNSPEKAFYYIEKSKALLLLENMTNSRAKSLAKLPESIIDREYDLISDIKNVEDELLSFKKMNNNKQPIDSLKNKLFSKKQSYVHFIDSLEMAYPRYYSFKKKITVFDSKMVQESLKDNEMVLQYNLNSNKGFLVLITKSYAEVFQLKNSTQIHEILDQYRDLISKPFVDFKDQQSFKEISYKLYENLFPFVKNNKDFILNKKLIIIPDSRLNYIPFESFVTNKNMSLSESYLLNFCEVSYSYSYSSLKVSHSEKFENDFFVINPSVFKDTSLSNLLISESNIAKLQAVLNTQMVTKEAATKQLFLDEYGKSKLVHVSTHGGVLDGKPWIAFNDEKLMLSDIYFKNQKADLVVLSACMTSHGEMKKGEGVMSIARAFVNSGSKSVVASLWDINQQSTNEVITAFYSNLKESDSKSEALKNAKLTYLKNHKNTSEASPFYWSSLVLIGNTDPMFDSSKNLYYAGIAFMVFVALIYIIFKAIRSKFYH